MCNNLICKALEGFSARIINKLCISAIDNTIIRAEAGEPNVESENYSILISSNVQMQLLGMPKSGDQVGSRLNH